ncbi:MAG: hypothetical protein ACO3VS_11655, partial [Limisphaerales bacterium]
MQYQLPVTYCKPSQQTIKTAFITMLSSRLFLFLATALILFPEDRVRAQLTISQEASRTAVVDALCPTC